MVGNDVVDIRDPESAPEALSTRFDARVFRGAERDRVEAASDSTRMRWRLWAAKEAAYKALRQLDSSTIFSPIRFEVELASASECAPELGPALRASGGARPAALGHVDHMGSRLSLHIDESECGVHAVATAESTASVRLVHGFSHVADVASHPEEPAADVDGASALQLGPASRAARELARGEVAEALDVSPGGLEIRKRDRVPYLYREGVPATCGFSLSHHGALVAYAALLPEPPDAGSPENGSLA